MEADGAMACFAWMVVIAVVEGKQKLGSARTATFLVPEPVAALVRTGVELGEADDKIFGRRESKKGEGLVGLLTGGMIDRAHYYKHALILACIPFLPRNANLY